MAYYWATLGHIAVSACRLLARVARTAHPPSIRRLRAGAQLIGGGRALAAVENVLAMVEPVPIPGSLIVLLVLAVAAAGIIRVCRDLRGQGVTTMRPMWTWRRARQMVLWSVVLVVVAAAGTCRSSPSPGPVRERCPRPPGRTWSDGSNGSGPMRPGSPRSPDSHGCSRCGCGIRRLGDRPVRTGALDEPAPAGVLRRSAGADRRPDPRRRTRRRWPVPAGGPGTRSRPVRATVHHPRPGPGQVPALGGTDRLARHVRPGAVAYVGHSLGGATSLRACPDDAACVGAVDLDGTPYGLGGFSAVQKPFLLVTSQGGCQAWQSRRLASGTAGN